MSQHLFHTQHNDKPVIVQMGYDRPLQTYHMVVYEPGREDDPLYSNLDQDDAFGLTLDDFRAALTDLGITVPESMFEQTELDAAQRRGNRYVTHLASGTFSDAQA